MATPPTSQSKKWKNDGVTTCTCPLRLPPFQPTSLPTTNLLARLISAFTPNPHRRGRAPFFSSASLSVSDQTPPAKPVGGAGAQRQHGKESEERVLISEVLVRIKDGDALERGDLEAEALASLRACRPNSALTVREVQEDLHRVIDCGYFSSCVPVAVDTRDGIRLVFQVEPNQEFQGLVCEGANALPSKFLEDAFSDGRVVQGKLSISDV